MNIHDVNLATLTTLIAELDRQTVAAQETLAKLRGEIERAKAQRDPLIVHLFRARQAWRTQSDKRKSPKRAEEGARQSFVEAMRLGFKGTLRDWIALLGMGGALAVQEGGDDDGTGGG